MEPDKGYHPDSIQITTEHAKDTPHCFAWHRNIEGTGHPILRTTHKPWAVHGRDGVIEEA